MEKGDAEKERNNLKAFKNAHHAVKMMAMSAAETRVFRRASLAKLQREDSVLRDFHIMENAPSYKKLEQEGEGGGEDEGSKSKPGGGFLSRLGAKNAKEAISRISSSASVTSSHGVELAGPLTTKVKKEEPRTFVNSLRNAYSDSTKTIPSDTAEFLEMGNLISIDAKNFMANSKHDINAEDLDETERELLATLTEARLMASSDDDESKAKFLQLFRSIDKNDSGYIDTDELATAFNSLQVQPTLEQLNYLVTKYDENGDGEIELDEFRKMYAELVELHISVVRESRNQLKGLFDSLDVSDRGIVTIDCLRRMFEECKHQPHIEQLESIVHRRAPVISRTPSDSADAVNFQMFLLMYDELRTLHKSLSYDEKELQGIWMSALGGGNWKMAQDDRGRRETLRNPESVRRLFFSIESRDDEDKGLGYVTQESLCKMLENMKVFPTKGEMKELVQRYDEEGRGIIDLNSFTSLAKDIGDSMDVPVPKTGGGSGLRTASSSGQVNSIGSRSSSAGVSAVGDSVYDKMEDLARIAVVGLSSEIRTVLANMAPRITGRSWVGLTWAQRYTMTKGIEKYLMGAELQCKAELERMTLDNPELEELLDKYGGSPPASREMAVRKTEYQSSSFESLAVREDSNQAIDEMSEEDAKDAVLAYSASVRQKASEDSSWPSGDWKHRLVLCRKRAATEKSRGSFKTATMPSMLPDDSHANLKFEALGGHWGDAFSGGDYAKRVAQYSADSAKSSDKITLRGGGKILGRLLASQFRTGKGKKSRAKKAMDAGPAVLPVLDEASALQLGGASGAGGIKPGSTAPRTGGSNKPGTSKSTRLATGSSIKSMASSKGSKTGEGEKEENEKEGEDKKGEAQTLVRAERLHQLKKSAMRVNLGVRLSKMAKGAHEKMLADLFREALNKDPETRSRSDIQIMSKLFGLCPQLKGIPRESMEKFCQLCTCELFQDGENVVNEGGESNAYFVIAVGFAKVFVRNSEGEGLTEVSTLGPGRAFGELGLIYDQPRSATVVADGVLIATRLERQHYMELFADFHTQKLFKKIQDKLNCIQRFKAWSQFELRPQFALTYLFTQVEVPDGTVLYDAEQHYFDDRYFQDKERYPSNPDGLVYFLQEGQCMVLCQARYTPAFSDHEESETIVVSHLSPGCFFGGPATPMCVSKIITKGPCLLFETAIDDVLSRMGPDIVPEMRNHAKIQDTWIGERIERYCERKASGSEETRLLNNSLKGGGKNRHGGGPSALLQGDGLRLPSMQMKQIGGYSGGSMERVKLGHPVSRPGTRGMTRQGSNSVVPRSMSKLHASMSAITGMARMRGNSLGGDGLDENSLQGWMSHVERRELQETRRKVFNTKAKAEKRKIAAGGSIGPPSQAVLQALLRGGAVSAEPILSKHWSDGSGFASLQPKGAPPDAGEGARSKAEDMPDDTGQPPVPVSGDSS